VAAALGGAMLLGVVGARSVPPPPPFLKVDPHAVAKAPAPREVEPEPVVQAEEGPGAGPALIWLLPMAGQLSGAPNAGE
jgi:hypothetical protein